MLANGLLLFLVTLIPFPTAVLARYVQPPGASVFAALYASVFLLITAAFVLLWHVVLSEPGLLRGHITDEQKRIIQKNNILGLISYVVACAAAFWQPYLTVLISISLSVYWVASGDEA